jgi:E3 ubiquitin-protein ligase DOA10
MCLLNHLLIFLFFSSRCDGSIKYLHQDCLMEWLRVSKKSDLRCELCGEKFSFRRVYAPDAPSHLSLYEFLLGLTPILASHFRKLMRVLILSLVWIFLMPFGTMWWLNLCLGYLSFGTWLWGPQKLTKFDSLVLWWDGVIVSALIGVATFSLMILLRPIFTVTEAAASLSLISL